MGVQWFVEHQGRVYGPFDAVRLKKLAAARKISEESRVAQSAKGPWVAARQIRGLFSVAATAASDAGVAKNGDSQARGDVTQGEQKIWLYKAGDQVTGPVSESEVDRLIAEDRITKTTLVLKVGHSRWETAFSAGLFLDTPTRQHGETSGGSLPASLDGDSESVLWVGKPAHAAQRVFYTLCALGSPLLVPAWWGLRRYVTTDATRYQVTNRRVRIRTGLFTQERVDVPLAQICDARLTKPWRLQGTRFCNVELLGAESSEPLAVLAAIPVDESALVISLCEAGADRQITVHAAQRIVAAAAKQERARMQSEMKRHADEIRCLKQDLADERKRVREAQKTATAAQEALSDLRLPSEEADDIAGSTEVFGGLGQGFGYPPPSPPPPSHPLQTNSTGAALWNVFCRGALSFVPVPPPVTTQRRPVSGLTAAAVMFGRRRKKTVRVKGHYRGRKWIAAHDREIG